MTNLAYNFAGNFASNNTEKINREDFYEIEYGGVEDILFFSKKKYQFPEPVNNKPFFYTYCVMVTNMYEITSAEDYKDEPYFIEVLMIPLFKSLHSSKQKEIIEHFNLDDEEYKEFLEEYKNSSIAYLSDVATYQYAVRVAKEEAVSEKDLDFKIDSALFFLDMWDRMSGFYLDRSWNMIGTTGWDSIKSFTSDKTDVDYTMKRYETSKKRNN